jgi:hypothetical protein
VFFSDGSSKTLQKTFCKKNRVEKFLRKIRPQVQNRFFSRICFCHVFGRFSVRGVQKHDLKQKKISDPSPFLDFDPPTCHGGHRFLFYWRPLVSCFGGGVSLHGRWAVQRQLKHTLLKKTKTGVLSLMPNAGCCCVVADADVGYLYLNRLSIASLSRFTGVVGACVVALLITADVGYILYTTADIRLRRCFHCFCCCRYSLMSVMSMRLVRCLLSELDADAAGQADALELPLLRSFDAISADVQLDQRLHIGNGIGNGDNTGGVSAVTRVHTQIVVALRLGEIKRVFMDHFTWK